MSDIFREVDEDLRRDRAQKLWETYGLYLIAAIVAVVVIVAGVSLWNVWQQDQAEEASAAYAEAEALADVSDDPAQGAEAFRALADDAPGGYETLAGMRAAAMLAEAGDTEAAVAAYDEVANSGESEILRELAALKAAMLLADTASPDDLELRLNPLARPGKPWRFAALEMLGYAALRADDREKALENFQALAEGEGAPPLARERARDMLRGLRTAEALVPPATDDAAPVETEPDEAAPDAAPADEAPAAEETGASGTEEATE